MKKKARQEGGKTHLENQEEEVKEAIYTQSVKKAPGPNNINFKIIRLLWEWNAKRIVALVRATIQLGHHPKKWKVVTGVVIPKPEKPDYSQAKAYRVIALKNCLEQVVENVVATMISEECERRGLLHDSQFGCRKRRLVVDVVGVMIRRVQEAWKRGNIMVALLMDVKGAFPSVAKGTPIQTIEDMKFEADLCRWLESFMSDRKLRTKLDGRTGKVMDVETGVLQGSPTSLILFLIYIAGLFNTAENAVLEVTMLFFVNDVAWVVEGRDTNQCTSQIRRCAKRAIQ
jgi:hypothetical protein